MRIADFETHGGGKAIITDEDISVEAIVRLDAKGMIESIESSRKTIPERDRPVPGHFASRFSSYAEVGGCRLPMQIASEIILPEGEYVCAEYEITLVEFDAPGTICQR